MKFSAAFLLALPAVAHAWTFSWDKKVDSGKGNAGCKRINMKKGTDFHWNRGTFEKCCIRMYDSGSCSQQIGLSCPDWKKTASQNVVAYRVTDC